MTGFKALVLDIEGTITSISFVKDELFPYAYKHVESFLKENLDNPDVQKVVEDLIELSVKEAETDINITFVRPDQIVEDLTHHVRYWIDKDKKLTPMKALQGLIWENAYKTGDVKGHVYADVLPVLKKLDVPIYIYSSGSVKAQKLLFSYSVEGDMTTILKGYFDTTVGLKGDAASYKKICEEIGQNPADVLFLTDIEAEARAAKASGLQSKLVIREGNGPLSEEAKADFATIHTLDEIL